MNMQEVIQQFLNH